LRICHGRVRVERLDSPPGTPLNCARDGNVDGWRRVFEQCGWRGRRVSLSTILAFAAGSLPLTGLGTAMSISVQPYFAQELGLGLVAIASAFFWVRVIDLGVDVGLAILMDRTKTVLGRYRAWMLAGAPILMLGVYQLFMAKKGIGVGYLIVWLLVYALGSVDGHAGPRRLGGQSGDQVRPARPLLRLSRPDLGGWPADGVRPAAADRMVEGEGQQRPPDGLVVLAMMPVATGITATLVREPINVDASTARRRFPLRDYWEIARSRRCCAVLLPVRANVGPGWMANLYLFFFTNYLLFTQGQAYFLLIIYILAGIFGAPLIGYLGGRFGKHRTLLVATLCYSAGLCTVVVLPKDSLPLAIPVMVWCGFMANGFDLMTGAMMADVGDQVRLEQGKERMALLYAATGLAQKLAAAGAVIIAYPLLAAIGYQPTLGLHNTVSALNGLEVVFITGPIFWVVLGGLCFLGWKLDAKKHAGIRAELEARDALITWRQRAGRRPAGARRRRPDRRRAGARRGVATA